MLGGDRIERLNKNNYDTWSITIQSILKSKSLWYLIEYGTELESLDVEEASKPENASKPEFAAIKAKLDMFTDITKNEEAKAILYTTMDRLEIQKTGTCNSAYDLWEKIRENHQGADVDQRNIALSEFLTFSYRKSEPITSYCGRFEIALSKVESSGMTLDESMKIWVFRNNLPNDIKTVANFWLMANPMGKISSLITVMKLQYHLDKNEKDESTVALYSQEDRKKPPNNDGNQKKEFDQGASNGKFCKYCKKKNHLIADCRKRIAKEKQAADSSSPSADKPKDAKQRYAYNAIETDRTPDSSEWIIDSGASSHMVKSRANLSNYQDLVVPKTIILGDGKRTFARGQGEYEFVSGRYEGVLRNVLWVPELNENLFSVGKAISRGVKVEFFEDQAVFKHSGTVTMTAVRRESNMFVLDLTPLQNNDEHADATIEEWHRRFGHGSTELIKQLAKSGAVDGLKIDSKVSNNCEDCAAGKISRASHPSRSTIRGSENTAVLQIDTCGPFSVESLGGSKYFVLTIEEFSNYKIIEFVRSKDEIPNIVKKIIADVETKSRRQVKLIQTDNGSEFKNSNLKIFLADRGIVHETTAVYTPEQNGSVERANRTVIEGTRALLNDSKLPDFLWAEAASTVVYTTNRLLGPKSPSKTRHEMYCGIKPDVRNLRVFGEVAFVRDPRPNLRNKFSNRGFEMNFVGYTSRSNTFKFYDSESQTICLSCDVKFDVQMSPGSKKTHDCHEEDLIPIDLGLNQSNDRSHQLIASQTNDETGPDLLPKDSAVDSEEANGSHDADNSNETADSNSMSGLNFQMDRNDSVVIDLGSDSNESATSDDQAPLPSASNASLQEVTSHDNENTTPAQTEEPHTIARRSLRSNTTVDQLMKPSNIMGWFYGNSNENAKAAVLRSHDEPNSLKEAMISDDWHSWKAAMDDEMKALQKNQTWILVPRSKDMRTIKSRWVFKLKLKADGSIERYKARLVAKGYSQIPNIDYKATFAPVASSNTIRMALAWAAHNDMELVQFDIKTAFLYGNLEEELFMDYPDGYKNPENRVCKLIKSLYGLKQAPRQWNSKFNELLIKFKLERSSIDRCLYYNVDRSLILIIYVDDGLIVAKNKLLLVELIKFLKSHFETKTMACETYLGFSVVRNRASKDIFLHQSSYANKILSRFNMTDCRAASTPEEVGAHLIADDSILGDNYPFKDLVGSLLYLVTCTRPDLAHAVSMASRTAKPTMQHWCRLKRILRYLKGTINYGIRFRGEEQPIKLIGFSDADYANDSMTRRSTSGYVILLGGGPIAWRCQQQPIIALSTTEAEFISGCELVKDLVPLRNTLIDIKAITNEPTPVYIDNISTVRIANDDGGQKRTKHIDVRYKWLNEQSDNKVIKINHISGDRQAADILTKPLHKTKFQANRNLLLSFVSMLALIMCFECKELKKVDPIEFTPSFFKFFNSAELWTVSLLIPNLCGLSSEILQSNLVTECHTKQQKLFRSLTHCNGILFDFNMKMSSRMAYGEDNSLLKPYYATFEGSRLIYLDEPARGLSRLNDSDKNNLIAQINSRSQSYLRKEMEKYKVSSNSSQFWFNFLDPLISNYTTDLTELNKKLVDKTLNMASEIWNSKSQSLSGSDEAKRAQLFNCSTSQDYEGVHLDLHFVTAARPDPTIKFFRANYFNFYNTTIDERNHTSKCWMSYSGPKHIMVNTTNDCMVEVDARTLTTHSKEIQLCERPSENLKAYASRMWHKEVCTTDIIPQKERVQFQYFENTVRIYCFPFNISLDNLILPCPEFVFEIDSSIIHRVAGMELKGHEIVPKPVLNSTSLLDEINSALKIDEIKISTTKMMGSIGNKVSETTNEVVDYIKGVPETIGNLTNTASKKLAEGAKAVTNKLTGGLTDALDTIWSYMKWAGIVLSVIASVVLLLLAAPVFELIFVAVRLIKVPYRKFIRLSSKILFKWNSSTIKSTTSYLEKTKNKMIFQRRRPIDSHRLSKIV